MASADEVLSRFVARAEQLSTTLQLKPGSIQEAAGILNSALGGQFIARAGTPELERTVSPFVASYPHPLGECLAAGGPAQVVEALEVAAYLKAVAQVPCVEGVLEVIRNDYEAGLLQLSYGFRFRRLDIRELHFEPPTAHGRRADISFEFGASRFLVECYVPRPPPPPSSYQLHRDCDEILSSFGDETVAVDIRLRKSLSPSGRREITRLIADARSPASLETEWADIQISQCDTLEVPATEDKRKVNAKLNDDADWLFVQSSTSSEGCEAMTFGDEFETRIGSRLRVWKPPSESIDTSFETYMTRLTRKVSQKLAQTVDDEGVAARLLILGHPRLMHTSTRINQIIMERLKASIERLHRRAAGVLYADRIWLHKMRYLGIGVYVPCSMEHSLPDQVIYELSAREEGEDPLSTLGY